MSYIIIATVLFCAAMVYLGWTRDYERCDGDWMFVVFMTALACLAWVITIPVALCVLSARYLYRGGAKVHDWWDEEVRKDDEYKYGGQDGR